MGRLGPLETTLQHNMAEADMDQYNDSHDEGDIADKISWTIPLVGGGILICAVICFFLTIALWFGHTTGNE
jgi:hypothetical protein